MLRPSADAKRLFMPLEEDDAVAGLRVGRISELCCPMCSTSLLTGRLFEQRYSGLAFSSTSMAGEYAPGASLFQVFSCSPTSLITKVRATPCGKQRAGFGSLRISNYADQRIWLQGPTLSGSTQVSVLLPLWFCTQLSTGGRSNLLC